MNRRLRHGPTRQSARSFGYKGTCKKPRYFYGTYYHIRGVYSKYTLLKTATDCLRLHVVSGLLRWRGDGADDVGEFASGAKLYGIAELRDFRMRVRGGGGAKVDNGKLDEEPTRNVHSAATGTGPVIACTLGRRDVTDRHCRRRRYIVGSAALLTARDSDLRQERCIHTPMIPSPPVWCPCHRYRAYSVRVTELLYGIYCPALLFITRYSPGTIVVIMKSRAFISLAGVFDTCRSKSSSISRRRRRSAISKSFASISSATRKRECTQPRCEHTLVPVVTVTTCYGEKPSAVFTFSNGKKTRSTP